MDMKNRKKTWKVFGLSLGLALVLLSTNANAQYEGNRGMFGKGESVDASPSRGLMDRGTTGSGITNQTYGSDADGFGITNQTYGQDAPLGSGLLIMVLAGACYAGMKRNKKQTKK
jgi:uncharacterized membrane protein